MAYLNDNKQAVPYRWAKFDGHYLNPPRPVYQFFYADGSSNSTADVVEAMRVLAMMGCLPLPDSGGDQYDRRQR